MFKIRWDMPNKLRAGFVAVILFMGIIAMMGWYSARRLVYIERAPRLAHKLDIKVLQCRREEKNIIIRGVLPEHVKKWRDAFSKIKTIGDEMMSEGYITPQEKKALEVKIIEYKKIYEALVLDIESKRMLSPEELHTYDEKLKDTGRSILAVSEKVIQGSINLSRRVERQTFILLLFISVFGIIFSLFLGWVTTKVVHRSMKEIEGLTHELEASSMELALGLSEHFEVLKRVAQGDLTVSAPEESENELLAKLGTVINQTIGKLIESARGEVEQVYTLAASGIRVIDKEFNITRTNRAMEELSGVNKEKALGMKCHQQLKASICQTDDCILKQILAGREEIEIEVVGESPDGRRIPCLVKAMPFRDTEGNITGIIEDIRNITQLKEIQEKLIRSEKLAALGKLAGVVAHELRNPLGVIKNAVYFLKMKLGQAMEDEKIKKHLKILEGEVDISDRIITDILTFGRVKEPQLSETNIAEIINESLIKVKVPENIEVVIKPDSDLPRILADGAQLKQVFSNIILNGIQAMPKGGRLTITGSKQGEFIEVNFADTGEGISEENLDKIFEPLFSTKAKGTGLGLAVCQSIINMHYGNIEVESEAGKGTKFMVKLPIANREG